LTGGFARRRESSRLGKVVAAIDQLGEGLEKASAAELADETARLRNLLVVEGLTDELVMSSFALIRETARRILGTPHYGVQLMGGWVMAQGFLAEMATGEGKTLTATLPAATAGLAGIPVHVISTNDYLVTRDAELMRPLYEALGLTVGTITEGEKEPAARRAAYACDITYATSNQLAFDYLRDRIAAQGQRGLALQLDRLHSQRPRSGARMLRGLCFAIVDEADSVLIDEARTPLILSRPSGGADQRRTYKRALRLARSLEQGVHFRADRRSGRIELTEQGQKRLAELAQPLGGFWSGPKRREEWVQRALSALHLFDRDHHYLVRDDKVQIIDQLTGRRSPDRSWEQGLHQLIELKEGCPVTPENETIARISYQQFFRRYLRLSGMTGTAAEVGRELWSVYDLNLVLIETRLPVQRQASPLRVFTTAAGKWEAAVECIRRTHVEGRPVLVGTCSVAASDRLSELLTREGLSHQVLNARQDAEEAAIVAEAGQPGRITVSTNMAGRGTDIHLSPGVVERGGLQVILTERSEAGRIDRQLIGRCARQGDPGSYEAILSLEDERVALYFPRWLVRYLARADRGSGILPIWLGRTLLSLPQSAEERRHGRVRRGLMELEEYMDDLLAFSGPLG
jgi:preprotein translocase subunit SecA